MARRTILVVFLLCVLGALETIKSKHLDESCSENYSISHLKKTLQSSSSDQDHEAEKAVDGDDNTCSTTSVQPGPWWEVNLGKHINVSMIRIKSSQKHPIVLHILVLVGHDQEGYTCGMKHVFGPNDTRVVRCVPERSGRVVRIQAEKNETTSLSLCEVQVFDGTVTLSEGVNYEAWFDVSNSSSLDSLYSHGAFEDHQPDNQGIFPIFQTPRNIADCYGIKLCTYYKAPESGKYIFYMSGDNNCRLFMRNYTDINAKEIATIPRTSDEEDVPAWTPYFRWNESTSEQWLKKNKVYLLVALMKEGLGADHLRVGVRLPSGKFERPMKTRLFTSEMAALVWSGDKCNKSKNAGSGSNINRVNSTRMAIETALNRLRSDDTADKSKILDDLENLAMAEAKTLALGNRTFVSFTWQTDDIVLVAIAFNLEKFRGFNCPESLENATLFSAGSISFPDTTFALKKGRAYMVCMMFKPLKLMKENTDGNFLGSNILSVVVEPSPTKEFSKPVNLIFRRTMNVKKMKQDCVYWIEDENSTASAKYGRWSSEGCWVVHKNETHTMCQCNHLTKFAVLFTVSKGSKEDEASIELITYIGLSVSCAACFIILTVYLILRITKTLKTIVHMNLVLALGLANLVFLLGNLAENNNSARFVCTVLAFYLYLAVFGWMLVEGVHLYYLVIRVFGSDDYRRKKHYYFIGWGVPLIIVIVTTGVMRDDLAAKKHCWLSAETGAIWAFIGPALSVIVVNTLILFAVLRTTLTVLRRDPGHRKEKSAMRTVAMLVPILGITWVFGVLAFAHDSIILQYIFAVCNAFQGFFIFILYCLFNSEVRHEFQRKMTAWKVEREIESKRSKQNNSFDANDELQGIY